MFLPWANIRYVILFTITPITSRNLKTYREIRVYIKPSIILLYFRTALITFSLFGNVLLIEPLSHELCRRWCCCSGVKPINSKNYRRKRVNQHCSVTDSFIAEIESSFWGNLTVPAILLLAYVARQINVSRIIFFKKSWLW